MGCGTSTNAEPVIITNPTTIDPNNMDLTLVIQQVKQSWPDIQKIPKISTKVFAHLIHKYLELKSFYHIPEAYKTEAELLNADEIKEPAERLIKVYSDIIESSDANFAVVLHAKAVELNDQGIRASQMKNYGESFVHVIKYELNNDFNVEEKLAWDSFTKQVSNLITYELSKFPRKSIFY